MKPMRLLRSKLRRGGAGGQATTEVVLLLPLFMFFLFAFSKVFALLVLVQKMEVASYYAARRWQLESHRNISHEGFDENTLCPDIESKVSCYLGFANGDCPQNQVTEGFLSLKRYTATGARLCPITRTQVWNVVTLTVWTKPVNVPLFHNQGYIFEVTKYVPNRDRPIAFILPGLNP
ncbi:MAG: hypothetical protein HY922_13365 [Elusimicrobia bacterium]|nr:hypothetical protein [Elusimicrobiota bacterium]